MADFIRQRDIQMLFTIGGDGTSRGAMALGKALRDKGQNVSLISLPKTIDNDLSFVDKSFGFETAFTIADQALKAAHAEANGAFNGVGLVKLMGRHSGYITTLASLANGDVNFVLIPEVPFELEGPNGLLSLLERRLAARGHAVIAVAEGAGQNLLQEEAKRLGVDASGNQRLADIGQFLKRTLEQHFKTRQIPINVRYIDPSYMIRSAPATPNDAVFCLQLAQNAVHAGMSGRTEMVVGIWKNTFTHVPLAAIIQGSRRLDPQGPLWLSLLQAIEQPARIGG
jgi:6-phosphofructokinase 1